VYILLGVQNTLSKLYQKVFCKFYRNTTQEGQVHLLTSVIPVTQEMEIGRIIVQGKVREPPSQQKLLEVWLER
jgi:hypothetical protein